MEITMTFVVAAGLWDRVLRCYRGVNQLCSVARPRVVDRSSARPMPEAEPLRPSWAFR
jgi:hypothetical protein